MTYQKSSGKMKILNRKSTSDQALEVMRNLKESLVHVSVESPLELGVVKKSKQQRAIEIDADKSVIGISKDSYTEVADGVYDRVLINSGDIKYDHELLFTDQIASIDFDKNHVIFVCFDEGSNFTEHYHRCDETILCLQGVYSSNGKEYLAGDVQKIPAMFVHTFKGVSAGYALLTLEK